MIFIRRTIAAVFQSPSPPNQSSHIRVCRFGDNMNNVAVTEGDKVEAQIKFGWEIDRFCR